MPLIKKSAYRARGPFRCAHVNTMFPALFRKVTGVQFERERVNTPDGWWLLRASNTQAALVARCEASDEAGLERLKAALREALETAGVDVPSF